MDPAATVLARKERRLTCVVVISLSLSEEGVSGIVLSMLWSGLFVGILMFPQDVGLRKFLCRGTWMSNIGCWLGDLKPDLTG